MTGIDTAYGQALLGWYLNRLGLAGDGAEFFDFSFGASEPGRAAVIRVVRFRMALKGGDEVWFFGTLQEPGLSRGPNHLHQFIGMYSSNALVLGELVAAACHYDRYIEPLGFGHTFPVGERSVLRAAGYPFAAVLDGGTYEPFAESEKEVAAFRTKLLAVVPISQEEKVLKAEMGLDALLDEWERSGKNVLDVDLPEAI
ncbi:MAG: suppressor of fused domain protein [Myxococcaceae bacterium]